MTRKRQTPKPLEFRYRPDREFFRVWRTDWAGDQFEVMRAERLDALRSMCFQFGIPIREMDDAEDFSD